MSTLKYLPYGDKAILIPEGKLIRVVEETYSPSVESNLEAWYSADSITSTYADTDSVVLWPDQSGNTGRNLLEATNAPVMDVDGGPNGYPSVHFDGTNDKLKTAAFTLNRPWHVFIVAKLNGFTDGDVIFDGVTSNYGKFYQKTATPNLTIYAGATMANYTKGNDATGTPAWEVYEVSNGTYPTITAGNNYTYQGTADDAGTNNLGGFTLGSLGSGASGFCAMDVAEVLVFSEQVYDKKLERIRTYLKNKYDLPVREPNIVFSSRDLSDTTVWSNPPSRASVGSTPTVCHDGTIRTTVELIEDGTANNTHYITQADMVMVDGAIYKHTFYCKGGVTTSATRYPCLTYHTSAEGWDGMGYVTHAFNLDTPGIITNVESGTDTTLDKGWEEADHGWYKVWFVAKANSTIAQTNFQCLLGIADTDGHLINVSGNGTSSVKYDDIKIERVG